ncbi:putative 2-dehydropantoate 2-reductase [Spirulina subsalsa]|uniref:putative 2-dehydropantoate 2-reductase n=1 Tax=Spirulina subsalsa TaxID=54311 RepID=UPI000304C59D|nr:putative 2-dehydropantoate 2-reductase [Spirulina subsalsa]
MAKRSYAIIGTGAIGGYYGACLQQAGFPVHFLVRSDYETIQQQGLIIESIYGDFTLPQVNAYRHPPEIPPCDVVIIALKSTQNQCLTAILPQVIHPKTVVILLQNGLGFEEQIQPLIPENILLAGLAFICCNRIAPGHIRHLDYQAIKLAQYAPHYEPCGITPTLEQICADFTEAKVEILLGEDLLQSRWEKLVWNIPYNSLSVILDAKPDEIMNHTATRELAEKIMREVQQGARSCHREVTDSFVEMMLDHTVKMQPYLTSMKLDFDHQRPLELEAILGNPLRMSRQHGVDLPKIAMLYQQLQFLDYRNLNS